jgi:class 3 adenylate cyclase
MGQVIATSAFALLIYRSILDLPLGADPAALEQAWFVQTRLVVPFNVGLVALGMVMRRRWPGNRVLAHVSLQSTMIVALWGTYLTGLYTDIFGISALFGISMAALAFFELPVVRGAVTTFLLGALGMTALEQLHLIPYAPLRPVSPIRDGHLDLLASSMFSMFLSAGTVIFFIAVTQRLRRVTALIRRYVPAQLAVKILADEHRIAAQPERRKLTLFFSDVVGFTAAADRMEPEDLAALLNDYLGEMTRIAEGFGATINQFVGDGIMMFFGAPEATTDHDQALRAVRMAAAMQRRMSELGEKWFTAGIQTPFRIRIGINTGAASVGDFGSAGRITYSAIGNQTNLTARIQAACEPGRILISHSTWIRVYEVDWQA